MNQEEKRKYEAFQYWIQTNTERGVTTIPDNLCLFIVNLIKSLQKENEELKISNKEIDKECSRLEKKEDELINENEHYKDLIYALKTYYEITEEDLEKCMKNDR